MGFANNLRLGITLNPQKMIRAKGLGVNASEYMHRENSIEKVGRYLTSVIYTGPATIWAFFKDPRCATVLTTLMVMYFVQLFFYTWVTVEATARVLFWILQILEFKALKPISYAVIQIFILGCGITAFGRFCNKTLVEAWYPVKVDATS